MLQGLRNADGSAKTDCIQLFLLKVLHVSAICTSVCAAIHQKCTLIILKFCCHFCLSAAQSAMHKYDAPQARVKLVIIIRCACDLMLSQQVCTCWLSASPSRLPLKPSQNALGRVDGSAQGQITHDGCLMHGVMVTTYKRLRSTGD